jgi:hypothetical protein
MLNGSLSNYLLGFIEKSSFKPTLAMDYKYIRRNALNGLCQMQ